jgi:beta-glucosidase
MWNAMKRLLCILFLSLLPAGLFGQKASDFSSNPSDAPAPDALVIERRVDDLLRKMTLAEKIGQMSQLFWDKTLSDDRLKNGTLGSYLFLTDPHEINRVQHVAVEQSRLHIPLLFGFDVIHGFHTIFPVGIAQAASWDPAMIEQIETTAALEASANGVRWAFAPMVDIARDARWGRIVEGAGEDPYLGSAVAAAHVRGFQGPYIGSPDHIVACAKHFAGYGAPDGGRDYDSVYLPETLLENVYFPPFHAAIQAGVGCIMSGYVDVNNVPASGNRYLLHDVLRKKWNYRGFVVSDAWAVYNLTAHGFARDPEDAAERGLNAGVNMDMGSDVYLQNLPRLVEQRKISVAEIDDAVRPLLRTKFELGLFEHPYVDEPRARLVTENPEHRKLARIAAERSVVLLRDQDHILPLSKSVRSIAVIGPLAAAKKALLGSWSFLGDEQSVITIEDGIRERAGSAIHVAYAEGTKIKREEQADINPDKIELPPSPDAEIDQAVAAAKAADVSVVVLGETETMSGEYASRSSLDLSGKQNSLLRAVAATGKPVVLVLISGRPLNITWASTHVAAILQAWFPGVEGGAAIASLLFGDANPAGKLPVTWPRTVGQIPTYYNHNLTQVHEDSAKFTSYYWDGPQAPLYRFGYGLSYSEFVFSNLTISSNEMDGRGLDVKINVKNTSDVAGDEVVQLYTHQRWGSESRPVRELKGFSRIPLAAGESKTVRLHLSPADIAFWSSSAHHRSCQASTYDVWVGDSSAATNHAQFEVRTTLEVKSMEQE